MTDIIDDDTICRLDEYQGEFEGNCPLSHEEAAQWREGWGLWARSDGYYQIQKFDGDPKERFQSDDEAVKYVRSKARAGSAAHMQAAALHWRKYGGWTAFFGVL